MSQKYVSGGILICQGNIFFENIFEKIFGNIAPLNLGNTAFFGCCPYFSTCLFLKSGTPTPTKVTFMK